MTTITTTTIDTMQQCENCSFEAKSIMGLSRHVKHKHGLILSTPKNTCNLCKKVFASSASCVRHVTTKVCIPKTDELLDHTAEQVTTKEEKAEKAEKATSVTETISPIEESIFPVIEEVHQIIPRHIEDLDPIKKSSSIVYTLVKIAICSVFFIPFLSRIKGNKKW